MKYRIVAGAVALSMILYSVISLVPCVNATSNVTEISSAEDFILFAKQCTLDSWSHGRTVKLLCDIDLCDKKFLSVPIFDGTFNGNGYTISGVEFKNSGSYIGLFRYINGKVINLNVRGNIIPDGSKNFVGGICGENAGIIENCSFSGTVAGKNVVGGICGSNTENGRIISCSFSGNINGENFTGGVVGKNGGFLQNCINNASVNTTYEEQKNDISNIETDRGAIVENYKNKEKERVNSYIDRIRIKTPNMEQLIKNLSGGNQQKVAIAKALMIHPDVLPAPQELQDKHYYRKHGANAYYGQNN